MVLLPSLRVSPASLACATRPTQTGLTTDLRRAQRALHTQMTAPPQLLLLPRRPRPAGPSAAPSPQTAGVLAALHEAAMAAPSCMTRGAASCLMLQLSCWRQGSPAPQPAQHGTAVLRGRPWMPLTAAWQHRQAATGLASAHLVGQQQMQTVRCLMCPAVPLPS